LNGLLETEPYSIWKTDLYLNILFYGMIKIYRVNHDEKTATYLGAIDGGIIKEQVSNKLDNLFQGDIPSDREVLKRYKSSPSYIVEDTENLNFTSQMIANLNGDSL
jgi:hypothetical protein